MLAVSIFLLVGLGLFSRFNGFTSSGEVFLRCALLFVPLLVVMQVSHVLLEIKVSPATTQPSVGGKLDFANGR
jgi:hypothetical protein